MINTQRERLIEILKHDNCPSPYECVSDCKYANLENCYNVRTADYLLEHGVIVLPCKVGDTVYKFDYQPISEPEKCSNCEYYDEYEVCSCFSPNRNGLICPPKCIRIVSTVVDLKYIIKNFYDFGKTVFLTREDAERALEEYK